MHAAALHGYAKGDSAAAAATAAVAAQFGGASLERIQDEDWKYREWAADDGLMHTVRYLTGDTDSLHVKVHCFVDRSTAAITNS